MSQINNYRGNNYNFNRGRGGRRAGSRGNNHFAKQQSYRGGYRGRGGSYRGRNSNHYRNNFTNNTQTGNSVSEDKKWNEDDATPLSSPPSPTSPLIETKHQSDKCSVVEDILSDEFTDSLTPLREEDGDQQQIQGERKQMKRPHSFEGKSRDENPIQKKRKFEKNQQQQQQYYQRNNYHHHHQQQRRYQRNQECYGSNFGSGIDTNQLRKSIDGGKTREIEERNSLSMQNLPYINHTVFSFNGTEFVIDNGTISVYSSSSSMDSNELVKGIFQDITWCWSDLFGCLGTNDSQKTNNYSCDIFTGNNSKIHSFVVSPYGQKVVFLTCSGMIWLMNKRNSKNSFVVKPLVSLGFSISSIHCVPIPYCCFAFTTRNIINGNKESHDLHVYSTPTFSCSSLCLLVKKSVNPKNLSFGSSDNEYFFMDENMAISSFPLGNEMNRIFSGQTKTETMLPEDALRHCRLRGSYTLNFFDPSMVQLWSKESGDSLRKIFYGSFLIVYDEKTQKMILSQISNQEKVVSKKINSICSVTANDECLVFVRFDKKNNKIVVFTWDVCGNTVDDLYQFVNEELLGKYCSGCNSDSQFAKQTTEIFQKAKRIRFSFDPKTRKYKTIMCLDESEKTFSYLQRTQLKNADQKNEREMMTLWKK